MEKISNVGEKTFLNVGSGPFYVDGYVNIDASPTLLLSKMPGLVPIAKFLRILPSHTVQWDRRIKYLNAKRFKANDATVSAIYSSHFLEHVPYFVAEELIERWFEMLEPGGLIRLALPDYDAILSKYIQNSSDSNSEAWKEFEGALLSYPLDRQNPIAQMLHKSFGHIHFWHPTKAALWDMLSRLPFRSIEFMEFRSSKLENIESLEHRGEFTFYIEAVK